MTSCAGEEGFDSRVRRRREIALHARAVGAADTDDLSLWLIAWVWSNPKAKDQVWAVTECARRMGRKGFTDAEAEAVVQEARATPTARSADELGRYLRLDYDTRQALSITTIGSYDVGKRERRRRRRERDRQAKEMKRREKGAKTRAEYEAQSISKAKPWVIEGISRKTWYKRQRVSKAA